MAKEHEPVARWAKPRMTPEQHGKESRQKARPTPRHEGTDVSDNSGRSRPTPEARGTDTPPKALPRKPVTMKATRPTPRHEAKNPLK